MNSTSKLCVFMLRASWLNKKDAPLDFSGILADVGIVRTSFLLGFNVPLASQSMQSFSESFGRGAENKESTAFVCEHKPDSRFQYHV